MGPKTVAQSFGVRAQIGPNEKSDRRRFVRRFRRRFRIQVTLGLAPDLPLSVAGVHFAEHLVRHGT